MAHADDEQAVTDEGGVLIPREQRHVLIEGEDVLAVWIGERDIYIPLRPVCEALGIVSRAQITRIKRDDVMAERLRSLRLETLGGPQTVQALHLGALPMWLAGLEPSRVKEELRPRLRTFKRWVREKVWEAFAAEMGWAPAASSTAVDPTLHSLQQVADLGRALVTMAEQQMVHHRALITVQETLSEHERRLVAQEGRLDRAAQVMGETIR